MSVTPIETSQFGTAPTPVRAPKQTMDGEVFLHLLVTQLANQDPSAPMDTNQMISQTTQLASMERLNTLAAAQQSSLDVQQRTAAAALIGREITTGGDSPLTGVVSAVSFSGTEPLLTVDGQQVPYGQVTSITAAGTDPAPAATPEPTPDQPAPETGATAAPSTGA